jgi:hypothetical protein
MITSSGDAPLLDFKQNGGMLMVKDRSKHGIESERSRKIGNQELLLGASMNRGRIEKNHRFVLRLEISILRTDLLVITLLDPNGSS